jgi:hypothetical protein
MKIRLLHLFCISLLAIPVRAQTSKQGLRSEVLPASTLELHGTSTMHPYEAKALQLTGVIVLDSVLVNRWNSGSNPFRQVEMTIPVKKLLSGSDKLNKNMWEALKADDHPDIVYHLTADTVIAGSVSDSAVVKTLGTLSLAGKENPISMNVTLCKLNGDTLNIKGSKDLLMTDFGIDPPSMMLGLLKTNNKVVIQFNLFIKPK